MSKSKQIAIEALEQIASLHCRPYEEFPRRWIDDVCDCADCGPSGSHPLEEWLCDQHLQPILASKNYYDNEMLSLGRRAKSIARTALASLEQEAGQ